jgi:hypothetical protein
MPKKFLSALLAPMRACVSTRTAVVLFWGVALVSGVFLGATPDRWISSAYAQVRCPNGC